MKTIRDAHFVPQWIDMGPEVPEPRIDWIENKKLDIAYGGDALQKLDLYYPNNRPEGPLPLVILVHGGGFALCDKRDWHVYPGFYALENGFALASVNYRLTPAARFPAPVQDLKAAIRHLRRHAAEYGLDADNFFLYGTSAGGNLVSMAALSNLTGALEAPDADTATSCAVNAVAALCPLVDFPSAWAMLQALPLPAETKQLLAGAFAPYLGATPDEDPETARLASATAYVDPGAPPFYLQHGTADPAVPVVQSTELGEKLRAAGGETVMDIMEGVAHAGGGPEYLEKEHIQPILDFFTAHKK